MAAIYQVRPMAASNPPSIGALRCKMFWRRPRVEPQGTQREQS
jgi:hypothetical protein